MAKILTQEQVDQYKRDGYLVARDVYTPAEIRELQEVTDEFVDRSRHVSEHTDIFDIDLKAGHSEKTPKLRRIKNPHMHHDAYDRAMRNGKLLDIIEQLIGPDIRHHHTKLNLKAPGGGVQVEWHTDWGFYPATNDDILEVGVAIDAMTEENGCLRVATGSHRGPAYDHHENGVFVGAVQMSDVDIENTGKILMNEGDVSLHHVRALHGSGTKHVGQPETAPVDGLRRGRCLPAHGVRGLGHVAVEHAQGCWHERAPDERRTGTDLGAKACRQRLDFRDTGRARANPLRGSETDLTGFGVCVSAV